MARCLRLPTDPSVHLPSAVTPPTLATHRIAIRVLFQVFIKDELEEAGQRGPGGNRGPPAAGEITPDLHRQTPGVGGSGARP